MLGNKNVLPQEDPTRNNQLEIYKLVIQDMKDKAVAGQSKYGTHLQPFNGRDALTDAYQEVLDLAQYLRQAIYERDHKEEGA